MSISFKLPFTKIINTDELAVILANHMLKDSPESIGDFTISYFITIDKINNRLKTIEVTINKK